MKAILEACVAVEERVGEIYRLLVGHPDAGSELREIWQEMAADELRHAQRIRQVGSRFEQKGVMVCGLTLEGVQQLLERAEELRQDAAQGRLSLDEAVYASVELEDAFMKVHLGYAESGNQPDLQTLFKALAEADRQHTARLRSYLNRSNDGRGLVFDDGAGTP